VSRFAEPQAAAFQALNSSVAFDQRLWPQDIAGSRAHAAMLGARGIISTEERDALSAGLEAVEGELRDGSFAFAPDDEDVHMAVERRLIALIGPVGGKLHTARSRNDQVATDVALFCKQTAQRLRDQVSELMGTLVTLAEQHLEVVLPGYTHLQRAQPIYLSHHLLAYVWMLDRDRQRLDFAAAQADRLPLGAGALAGVNFDTDRRMVADELGFAGVVPNSVDAVSNRDFVLDLLHAAATCATHLSRLGSELVIWSSQEFGFVTLADRWTSGSSIMPQKKNPDAAELLRGKAPRVVAHGAALHGVLHALPLTYNKDMQEDKEHLFDAVDTLALCLAAAHGMLDGAAFDSERMAAAASDDLIAATDLADLLVKRGVPFRECHGIVAGLVRAAVESGRGLAELSDEELAAQSPHLDPSVRSVFERSSWLEGKVSEGGTAPARVREQLALAQALLAA